MPSRYLAEIRKRVVVFDGAMGTEILKHEPKDVDYGGYYGCVDYLVVSRPDIIQAIHESYLAAGCDVVETNTFRANRITLKEYNLHERVRELNMTAARIARAACDKHATPARPRFVAGSIGPSGFLPSSTDATLSAISYDELAEAYREQAAAQIEGGVDVLLIETSTDILEVKAQVEGCNRARRSSPRGGDVALQAQVTFPDGQRMLLGTDIDGALTTLEALEIDVIGMNCSTGPEQMRDAVRILGENSGKPVSVIPNAGMPENVDGKAVFRLTPDELAANLTSFIEEYGINVVGGCCGTTPEHIRRVAAAVKDLPARPRNGQRRLRVSSAMTATPIAQEPAPTVVGERINATGSRKVKKLLIDRDYDAIVAIARSQVAGGAHVLDVSCASNEIPSEKQAMLEVVKRLANGVEAPLMFDSTEADVIEAALKIYPGRGIVNSINMENGRQRIEAVMPLVKQFGCAVVALCIDETGMAKTRERKLEIARKIHDIVTREFGALPGELIFDTLTFPLSTGQAEFENSAVETLEGIRAVKREMPGVRTILGVSNVSFGFNPAARQVLNSVFLYQAVQAGLDLAIVNPNEVKPYPAIDANERELANNLIFNRLPSAAADFIAYFEGRSASAQTAMQKPAGMTAEQEVHYNIANRIPEGVEALIDEALKRRDAVGVINEVLLPAMKEVGDRFGAGELILPFVLQSAEVMKKSVAYVEQFLAKDDAVSKGTVILATVYGDVHDIGKNLVKTVLSNNGFTVVDLGKQVPIEKILGAAQEIKPVAIGLSALLVSTSRQMPLCVKELQRHHLPFPVIIGGAAINREFGRKIYYVDGELPYIPGVYYANDAFEGLDICNHIAGKERESFRLKIAAEAAAAKLRSAAPVEDKSHLLHSTQRSGVARNAPVPAPPFWGVRVLGPDAIPMDDVFACMDHNSLYRLSWGARGAKGEEFDKLMRETFEPKYRQLTGLCKSEGWLLPKVVYGYFPCRAEGNAVVVYDPKAWESSKQAVELQRFEFLRQPEESRLCLADYYRAAPDMDMIEFQLVTVGDRVSRVCDEMNVKGQYADSYYLHGLSVEAAEGLAEWMNRRARAECRLPDGSGKRYSFGYPACPELSHQAQLFRLMEPEKAIGVTLTESFQLVPEQSTSAFIVHHPEARYFHIYRVKGV